MVANESQEYRKIRGVTYMGCSAEIMKRSCVSCVDRLLWPRTKIKVNGNTDRLIGMLTYKDRSLTVTSDEIHMDKSNELNKE
ncbi:hypothetical protein Hanom_Chr11g01010091 [Helianthus anomalus]